MSRINILVMEPLTNEEMIYLLGGSAILLNELACIDINNTNSVATCACTYKNKSVISNDNSVSGCRCLCM